MADHDLVDTLQELAEVLQTQQTLGAVLARIGEAATVSIPACDASSVAISIEGRPSTAAITARVALELDLVQYDSDDGPCLRCFRTMSTLRVDLVEDDERFPHFSTAARKAGIRSVLSVPATWAGEAVGTMNLYSRIGPFDESARMIAAVLAAQVAIAISRSPEYVAARKIADEAQQAADDAAQINVATGLLMINEACTVEQADGLLRQAAGQDERTVLQIARRIINQHQRAT